VANARKFVALGGMVGILVLAWGFDRLYEFARRGIPSSGDPLPPVIWVSAITNWALAVLVLLLAWFVIFKNGGSPLVFLIFLLVGLLVTFSFSLEPLSLLSPLLGPIDFFLPGSPRSLYFQASAFISIIGTIGLLARRRS
jgi:hypothetical protein